MSGEGVTVTDHCVEVADCAGAIVEVTGARLAAFFGLDDADEARLGSLLRMAALLHDLGKAGVSFQNQMHEGVREVHPVQARGALRRRGYEARWSGLLDGAGASRHPRQGGCAHRCDGSSRSRITFGARGANSARRGRLSRPSLSLASVATTRALYRGRDDSRAWQTQPPKTRVGGSALRVRHVRTACRPCGAAGCAGAARAARCLL